MDTVRQPCPWPGLLSGSLVRNGPDPLERGSRFFGTRGKIVYVHFRDVQGVVPSFAECFLGEGNVDVVAAIRTLKESGFRRLHHRRSRAAYGRRYDLVPPGTRPRHWLYSGAGRRRQCVVLKHQGRGVSYTPPLQYCPGRFGPHRGAVCSTMYRVYGLVAFLNLNMESGDWCSRASMVWESDATLVRHARHF